MMVDNMSKFKIESNIGVVGFLRQVASFNSTAKAAIFVISGNGQHPK